MSKKKKATAAGVSAVEAVDAVKSNPYIQKVATDGDLHDNVRVAYESARTAYERLASGKSPSKAVLEDKKLHANVATAVEALKDVGYALADAPSGKSRKKKGGLGRKLLVLVVGAGVAVAVSSDVRNKLLDLLFGAEEEFDYTSTTAPATPAPSPAPGAPTT
jgi:hypothetical protein